MYKITSVIMYSPEMKIGLFQRAGRQILVWRLMEASDPDLY